MDKELKSAIDAAKEAGSIIMNYYKSKYEIRYSYINNMHGRFMCKTDRKPCRHRG